METTPGLTHNAAGPKGAYPRDSWPYVFLFSSQGKRKPSGILIYKKFPRAPPLDSPLDWNAPAGQLSQMETTPRPTHNAAAPECACPRDSWPYVFLFFFPKGKENLQGY